MTDYLRQLLNVFWLRPETAMWRACDIQAMRQFEMRGPSLDLGCGDGVFSFIRAGGQFKDEFDAFQSVGNLDKFFAKADVFDHYEKSLGNIVKKPPDYRIDVGFDHKENLLKKAADLGFYGKVVQGDGNKPLPFPDGNFQSVFSNIVYWLDEPAHVFAEIARVLKPGGKACVFLPNTTLPTFSFYHRYFKQTGDQRFAFLDMLDRGRLSDNIKQSKSDSEWREIFQQAGLSVASHTSHLSGPIVQIWDVGLRPLFPILWKMVNKINAKDLPALKAEWVDTFEKFAKPLVALDEDLSAKDQAGFHCYVLQKPL